MGALKYWLKRIIKWFLSGLIILLPLGATLILIGWAVNFLDQLVGGQSIFAKIWSILFSWLELGDVVLLFLGYFFLFLIIILVGYIAHRYAQKSVGKVLRSFFDKIPIINKIYASIEQVIDLWSRKQTGEEMQKIGEVVMVQFMNVKVFGILSSRNKYKMNGEDYYLVYLPSAPIPATGFTYFFKIDEVEFCDMKMEDMTKILVSLGVLAQEVMGEKVPLKTLQNKVE